MTEEEAKQRWCPFVRLTGAEREWHTNRDPSMPSIPTDTQAYRCIGSACMAWRWRGYFTDEGRFMHMAGRGHWKSDEKREPTGFCGLAGRP